MKLKKIRVIEYHYGNEEQIKEILYHSKEPILIKIKDFPNKFTMDYFEQIEQSATYDIFNQSSYLSHQTNTLKEAIKNIKQNKPYRIFGQILPPDKSNEIERYIPLWSAIPFRPRYFYALAKMIYFFGGKGSSTYMHYDREHNCNLQAVFCGTKQMLLFTEDQSKYLYKVPYIGDSVIDFSQPIDEKKYPLIAKAEGYLVTLQAGDMIFMPRKCWHFTTYLDASAAATYAFYSNKFLQYYGYYTGHFYMAYLEKTGQRIGNWPLFKKYSLAYAMAGGFKKGLYKIIEKVSYVMMLPVFSIYSIVSLKFWPRSPYSYGIAHENHHQEKDKT